MLKVALTGGIATGKSYVLDALRRRGVPCLDADALAHGVMAAGTEASRDIAARFGDVLTADGAVDRRKLAPIVFADASARRELEAIVHPAVYRAVQAGLRAFQLVDRAPLAVVDVPLLYESGRAADFDRVIATVCSVERQRERLRARGFDEKEIDLRLAAQLPAAEKARRADLVISTDGTFDDTERQIATVLQALR
ncbi:MAG: dephospho-CoA kinase [Vicinamibacterales bacterium]